MDQVTTILGDNDIIISGEVTRPDRSVGWPGGSEVEQVFVLTAKKEMVDITELIHTVLHKGPEIWDYLSQELYEETLSDPRS